MSSSVQRVQMFFSKPNSIVSQKFQTLEFESIHEELTYC